MPRDAETQAYVARVLGLLARAVAPARADAAEAADSRDPAADRTAAEARAINPYETAHGAALYSPPVGRLPETMPGMLPEGR